MGGGRPLEPPATDGGRGSLRARLRPQGPEADSPPASGSTRRGDHSLTLEDEFATFCRDHDLPTPSFNTTVLGFEVDALWPRERLAAELDSWEFHRHRAAFERDRARDTTLQVAGYRTIRITHRRLTQEAPTLAKALRALLTAGA